MIVLEVRKDDRGTRLGFVNVPVRAIRPCNSIAGLKMRACQGTFTV